MIEVGVVDLSADSRRRLAALLERWMWVTPDAGGATLPKFSLRLLSHEEVRFHGALDLCVIGAELISSDLAMVAAIRRNLPDRPILCVLDSRTYSIATVEQLSRLGVDDVLTETASSDDFYRRVILLGRRASQRTRGSLIVVDSARGGVGATMIAAGLGETVANSRKSVCLLDTDTFSQDMTRFLQCRPYVSEAFKLLLENQRVATVETLSECAIRVWEDESNLHCVPPPAASDQGVFSGAGARTFASIVETFQMAHQVVIVDASSLPASTKQLLYQGADSIVFVTNRDPAGAFANRQAIAVAGGFARVDARIALVINDSMGSGLPAALLERELLSTRDERVRAFRTRFSRRAAQWPCSGATAALALERDLGALAKFAVLDDASSDATVWHVSAREKMLTAIGGALKNCGARFGARIRPASKFGRLSSPVPASGAATVHERSLVAFQDGLVSRPTIDS